MRSLFSLLVSLPIGLTALGACTKTSGSDGPTVAPLAVSGSRLRVIWLEGPDDLRVPLGWMDTQRSERCNFTTAEDGAQRCLPNADGGGSSYFSDAACTKPVVLVRRACSASDPAPKYAFETVGTDQCHSQNRLHTLGAKLPATTSLYFAGNGPGGCFTTTASNDQDLYELGPALPATDFVASGEPGAPEKGGRLAVTYRTAEDGSKLADRLIDTTNGKGCSFRYAADGELRCLPQQGVGYASYFSDGACTAPVYLENNPCATEPVTSLLVTLGTECPRRTHVFAKGAAIATTPLFSMNSDTRACEAASVQSPGVVAYGAGAEADATTFARGVDANVGSGRFQLVAAKPDDGPLIAGDDVYDSLNDVYGSFVRIDDQTARFRPSGANISTYADAACTQPIATSYDYDGCVPPHPLKFAVDYGYSANGCPGVAKVYKLGAPVTPDKRYENYSGACTPRTGPLSVHETFYAVGEEVPAEQWPTAAIKTE